VNSGSVERIRRANDCSDVEIVLPVLDGYVKTVSTSVELRDNRLVAPVPIAVEHVPSIAIAEQFRI
jgi:hypothetical protein